MLQGSKITDKQSVLLSQSCKEKLPVENELNVPGEISGYDCLDDSGLISIFYRESKSEDSLAASFDSLVSMPDKKLYYLKEPGWYAVVDEVALEKPELKEWKSQFQLKNYPDEANAEISPAKECAISLGVMAYNYLTEGTQIPAELSAEHAKALKADLADETKVTEIKNLDPDTFYHRHALGNLLRHSNKLCEHNPNYF